MASTRTDTQKDKKRRAPATTPEAREKQLTMLAYDEAERLITSGEASSQILTHFPKVGSAREQKEQRRLELEAELLQKKIEDVDTAKRIESLYDEAIKAMRSYGGQSTRGDEPLDD